MQFYSFKHKAFIEVPNEQVRKKVVNSVKKDSKGSRLRYSALATIQYEGAELKLNTLISKQTYDNLNVEIVE